MIRRLINRIKLALNPPKAGDVYYGDPFDFVLGKLLERVLHDMVNIHGDILWEIIPSDDCIRLTVDSASMPYYICASEALCRRVKGEGNNIEWRKRSLQRRLLKEEFHKMIIDGRLKKA